MHTFKPMKKRLRYFVTMVCLVFWSLTATVSYAQNPQTIEVGPHFGATAYVGDLNVWRHLPQWEWKQFNQFHYDWGVVVRYNYDSRWSFRLDYSHLRLRASDTVTAWRPQANLNFKSTVDDLSFMVEFNFLDYYTGKINKGFSPYIFAGVSGLMYYVQPYTGIDSLDVLYLNNLGEKNGADVFEVGKEREGRNFALSIPFGVGCKVSISNHLAATAEWRMHYTLTDYLDGVHGNYGTSNKPEGYNYDFNDPTETFPEGYQRGNARNNDWFGMLNLSLTWKFVIPEQSACKMTEY